jgi:hypothetical protein
MAAAAIEGDVFTDLDRPVRAGLSYGGTGFLIRTATRAGG